MYRRFDEYPYPGLPAVFPTPNMVRRRIRKRECFLLLIVVLHSLFIPFILVGLCQRIQSGDLT
ncbi:hypothetical protein K3W78_14995, partial [Listeria monocytogenes]|nr:hypothetical protein [Listeria monocytogenes]